jgi:hypothetical protein
MKAKLLLMTGLTALGLVGVANAANYVYITGSTAYRNAVNKTINAMFDTVPTPVQVAAYGKGITLYYKATYLSFEGTIGGVAYKVKCHWSGSEGGIKDIATGISENFLDDIGTGTPAVSASVVDTSPNSDPPGTQLNSHGVDLALADNAQSFSKTKTPALTGVFIGIIPFVWDKNAQITGDQTGTDWARITNLTDSQARVLLTGGALAALITGNSGDTAHYVYVSGRDDNSGTRVNTFGETLFGIRTIPTQILIGGSAGSPTIASSGNVGQSSGGTLANTMGFAGSLEASDTINGGTGWIALAYLGLSDAVTAETANGGGANGAQRLSFNGVTESTTAIQQGQYSFWGNEYIFQAPAIGSPATTVYNNIVSGVDAQTDGINEISIASMHSTRLGPLSDPTHN